MDLDYSIVSYVECTQNCKVQGLNILSGDNLTPTSFMDDLSFDIKVANLGVPLYQAWQEGHA